MIRHHLIATLTATLIALTPAIACAADDDEGTGFVSSTTSVMLNMTTLMALIYPFITTLSGGGRADLWRDYLERNRAEVVAGLTLGAGPAVDDLAVIFGVRRAERRAFGRLLRHERGALLGHLGAARLSDDDARRFALHINRALRRDPALASTAARLAPPTL